MISSDISIYFSGGSSYYANIIVLIPKLLKCVKIALLCGARGIIILAAGLTLASTASAQVVTLSPPGAFSSQSIFGAPGDSWSAHLVIDNTSGAAVVFTGLRFGINAVNPTPVVADTFGTVTITNTNTGAIIYGPAALTATQFSGNPAAPKTGLFDVSGALAADRTVADGTTVDLLIEVTINPIATYGLFNVKFGDAIGSPVVQILGVQGIAGIAGTQFTSPTISITGPYPPISFRNSALQFSMSGKAPVIGIGTVHDIVRFWPQNFSNVPQIIDGVTIVCTPVRGFTLGGPFPNSDLLEIDVKIYSANDNVNDGLPTHGVLRFFGSQTALGTVPLGPPDAAGRRAYRFILPGSTIFGTDPAATVPIGSTAGSTAPAPIQVRVGVVMNSAFGHAIPGDTGGVNPGDAWIMGIESYFMRDPISGLALFGTFSKPCVSSPVHEVIRFPDTYSIVAHPLRDVGNTGLSDGKELDRISWFPVFGLHAAGGPALPERFLDEVDLKISGPGAANLVNAASPLAQIDGFSVFSGIQARRNTKATAVGEGESDDPLDLGSEDAVSFTSADDFDNDDALLNFFWSIPSSFSFDAVTQTALVRMNFAGVIGNENLRKLPNTDFKKANTVFDKTRGANPDFWIGIIPADSAVFADTYTISIDTIIISSTPFAETNPFQTPGVFYDTTRIFHDTAGVIIGVPVTWHNFVGAGQLLARLSPPTVVAGISAVDGHGFRPALTRLQFYVLGDTGLTSNDFLQLDKDATISGFAIYRDAKGKLGNGPGTFEAGIDTPIPLIVGASRSRFEALPQNSIHAQFGAQNGFRVYMELDTSVNNSGLGDSNVTRVLPDKSGVNAGDDFFLVIRTSASASTGRTFRIVFGEMEENNKDQIYGFLEFETVAPDLSFVAKDDIFDSAVIRRNGLIYRYGSVRLGNGDPAFFRSENNFRTDFLTVGGAIGASYVDQITSPRTVFPGESFAIMGVNAVAGSGNTLRLISATVHLIDGGGASFDSSIDILPISSIVTSASKVGGVAFFSDLGESAVGTFDDVQGDSQAAGTITRQGRDSFIFTFIPTLKIPDDDSGLTLGSDFFVVVSLSDNLTFGDSFFFRMPDSALVFSDPSIISAPAQRTTPLLTAGMPFKMKNIADTPVLSADSTPKSLLGFSVQDTTVSASGNVRLKKVSIDFVDFGNSGFSLNSLAPLTIDRLSGVALYKDEDGDRRFIFDKDSSGFIAPVGVPTVTLGQRVVITVDTTVAAIDTTFASDTQAFFFLVVRANSAAGPLIVGHRFTASFAQILPTGSVNFTAPVNPKLTITTPSIEIQTAGVFAFFTPGLPKGYGRADTTSLTIKITPPFDTWAIRFINRNGGKISDSFPAGSFTQSSTNKSDSVVTLNKGIGPTQTGAYGIEMVYFDIIGRVQIATFGGDTLFVDSFAVPPILDTSAVAPITPTTDSTSSIGITINLDSPTADRLAQRFGEQLAKVSVFRSDGSGGFQLVGAGTMTNYKVVISANLNSGINNFFAVLTDSFGNVSDTTFITTVQRNVGNNVIEVRKHPQLGAFIGPTETMAVLSINVTSAAPGEVINSIKVVITESVVGAFTFGQNIEKVSFAGSYLDTAGIAIFRDLGIRGVFDTFDQRIPISASIVTEGTLLKRATVELIPSSAIVVPVNDTDPAFLGDDFLIVINGGNGALFLDSFSIGIPPGGFAFSPGGRSNITDTVMTSVITTRVPRFITLPDTLSTINLNVGGSFTPIFALNMFDTTRMGLDGGANLSFVNLIFGAGTIADTNIFLLDFALFRDTNFTNSARFGLEDSQITTSTAITSISAASVTTLATAGNPQNIPGTDVGFDSGPDFFVCVKVKTGISSIGTDHGFSISIPSGGIGTTGDQPGGPGSISRSVIIKAGSIPSNFVTATAESGNYFNPNGPLAPGKFDTIGYHIVFSDTRPFKLFLTQVSTGRTFFYDSAKVYNNFIDTTFVFAGSDTSGWITDEYRVTITDSAGAKTDATPLIADRKALTPTLATTPPTTTTGTTVALTIRLTEFIDVSTSRAIARSEHDSFALVFRISSTISGDTFDTAFVATSWQGTLDVNRTIPLFNGANTVRVTLIDRVGNQDSSLVFSIVSGSAITGNIGFEGNAPVFKYNSVTNPTFTFSFPTAVTGGTMEFFNIAGDRLRLITLPAGVTSIDWNAANNAGQLLRNGVYIIKFKVPLVDGRTIEESRTIFLLK